MWECLILSWILTPVLNSKFDFLPLRLQHILFSLILSSSLGFLASPSQMLWSCSSFLDLRLGLNMSFFSSPLSDEVLYNNVLFKEKDNPRITLSSHIVTFSFFQNKIRILRIEFLLAIYQGSLISKKDSLGNWTLIDNSWQKNKERWNHCIGNLRQDAFYLKILLKNWNKLLPFC